MASFDVITLVRGPVPTDDRAYAEEKILGLDNLYDPGNITFQHHVLQALKAHKLFKRDDDYIVKDGQVVIVDTRKRPVSGDFAVVGLISGDKYVKRYREAGGRVLLESVNPLYPPVVVEPREIRFAYKITWTRER